MTSNNYQGKKFTKSNDQLVNDYLTIEQALQISINTEPFTITMRTPENDKDLIRGLLFSEDIYKAKQKLDISFYFDTKKNVTKADVSIEKNLIKNGYLNSRNILSVSSCGICGKKELETPDISQQLKYNDLLDINQLYKMFDLMKEGQTTFHQSGGSHAAAVFNANNKLLCIMEDIGRHNAVDKVIGYLLNNNLLDDAKYLLVSGRVSYEIISKTFTAKIPFLAAVSAPSTLAVDFAKELGITLLGFCRENKATCYSHTSRLKVNNTI